MKKMIIFFSLAISVIASGSVNAREVLSQETLYTCSAEKWNSIRIVKERFNKIFSYSLILETGSRERPAVGAYIEGQTNVVFGLDKLTKKNGDVIISGNFRGTQPVNTSTTSLVGLLKKRTDGTTYLEFALVEGPHHVETTEGHTTDINFSFAFFQDRLKTLIFDSGATSNTTLECNVAL